MKPMFLPEVENHSQPGARSDMIHLMRNAGKEYPQIWHLFAFRPEATDHLGAFTQEFMRGECPLSSGLRELIAAFTSSGNNCPF
jgi:hypothetical protein